MKYFLFFFCLLGAVSQAGEEAGISFRTIFFKGPAALPEQIYAFDGKNSQKISLPKTNFSPFYRIPNGCQRVYFTMESIVNPKLIPKNAPFLDIPPSTKNFYILFSFDKSNESLPIKPKLIDLQKIDLKFGETYWFNLTDKLIVGKLGNIKLLIKPKETFKTANPTKGGEQFNSKIFYVKKGSKTLHPFVSHTWLHDDTAKQIGLIFNTSESDAPGLIVIPDHGEPPSAE